MATNKHFNDQMNMAYKTQSVTRNQSPEQTPAKAAYDSIRGALTGGPSQWASEKGGEQKFDRMERRDFSRKTNSFVPVLVNDSYSNFRFNKRDGELFSPLSKTKFGFNTQYRKMSMNLTQQMNSSKYGSSSKANNSRFGSRSLRLKSVGNHPNPNLNSQ